LDAFNGSCYAACCRAWSRYSGIEVGFEAFEGLPVVAAEEFVLEVSEDLFGGTVVDAVAFA